MALGIQLLAGGNYPGALSHFQAAERLVPTLPEIHVNLGDAYRATRRWTEAQRAYRLVRNILMAGEYTYLGLRGLVWSRWPQSATSFQPQLDGRAIQHVQGFRLAFRVVFNEFSPQVAEEVLEFVSIDFKRAEDGEILVEADYDYT